MNINRDNYEEFFILYGDNELGSEDKILVEAFVLENPDLQSEFSALNQVRFSADEEILFDFKDSLMQTAGLTRNEELLLLSVDNELTTAQQKELHDLLSRDGSMQAELDLYKKASFDPNERIVFPYKESLYRREEKVRVIPFAWQRFAAAAAILVAVSVTAFIVFNGKEKRDDGIARNSAGQSSGRAVETGTTIKGATGDAGTADDAGTTNHTGTTDTGTIDAGTTADARTATDAGTTPGVKTVPSLQIKDSAPDNGSQSKEQVAFKDKSNRKINAPLKEQVPVGKDAEQVAKAHNNLPQPLYNPNVNETGAKDQIAMHTAPAKQITTSPNQINTDKPVTITPDDPYKLVVNKMPDPGDDADDQGPSSKKSKFRGFFRKVTRTFEKNTNIKATDDEDRLLVGGLAIRL